MIVLSADNRPPKLDNPQYESWKRRIELYIHGKDYGRKILNLVKNSPLVWPTVELENDTVRPKTYEELSDKEKLQADCDLKATKLFFKVFHQMSMLSLINTKLPKTYGIELSCFCVTVLTLFPSDDPIVCMNKAMAFLLAVFTPRYPSTNNQLRSSFNQRNQATVQDGRVTIQQVQRDNIRMLSVQPKRRRDATWFKEKVLLVQAHYKGNELDKEKLAFLADPRVVDGQVAQTITHNVAFQISDLDAYKSGYDHISSAKAVLMANLSSCDSDVLSEAIVQNTNTFAQQNSMILSMFEQMSDHATNWDKANNESKIVNESLTDKLERYKERVKILEQGFNVDLNGREKFIDSQMDDMIRMKNTNFDAFKTEIDTLKHALSKHVKKKESLLTTLNGFKTEFKERESKSIDKEIVLEHKNKELENIVSILKQFQATPPPASVKAVEEICVTCGGAHQYYQCLAANGNPFPELRDNIQGYVAAAAVNYNQGNSGYRPPDQPYQAPTKQNQVVPLSELEKIKKVNEANMKAMQIQINNVKIKLRNEIQNSIQASMSNQTNELKNMMASFFQMNTASTLGSGSLPGNTIANPKGKLKAITTRSGIVLDETYVPIPPPFINPKEDERIEETLTDQDLAEYTIKVPPPLKMLKALLSNKEKLLELENTPLNENCSAVILKKLPEKLGDPGKFIIPCGFSEVKCKALANLGASINLMPLFVWKKLADFVIVDYESDPRVPLILGRPFLRTARALIDVHGEEMILHDGDERLTLNMRHDTLSYPNQPQKESISMINVFNDSSKDFLEELFTTTHQSGNPTFSSHPKLTSPEVKDDVFDPDQVLKPFFPSPIPDEDSDYFLEKSDTSLYYSDIYFPEFETFIIHTEETNSGSTTTHTFYFNVEEKNSGSTTTYADISLPDLECFKIDFKPDPCELTSIIDSGIHENVHFATNMNLPPEEDHSPLFAFVVWIFLSFLTYPVIPPNLLSFRNEDTIFDPGIANYHFPSLLPDASHRCETFMKFNVYPKTLE
nr:hypothetical protein [Tanacetum cinerariifolium]